MLEAHLKNPECLCNTQDCYQHRQLQQKHRLDRHSLKGEQGDAVNAIAAAAGYNLRWLMRWIVFLCTQLRGIMRLLMVQSATGVDIVIY